MCAASSSRLVYAAQRLLVSSRAGVHHHHHAAAARHVACAAAAAGAALHHWHHRAKAPPRFYERPTVAGGGSGGGISELLLPLQVGIAARFLSSASGEQPNQRQQQQQQPAKGAEPAKATEEAAFDSLELTDEKINAITDKIPQRPVGAVEATSYSAVIAAAFACLAYFVYNLFTTLVLEPVPQRCFNAALERLRGDPRVTVRVGSPVTGFGQDSANRTARHVIPHSLYRDAEGREHCRLQFHIRGPGGSGVVSADMYRGGSEAAADSGTSSGSGSAFGGDSGGGGGSGRDGEWRYLYLVVDVAQPGGGAPQRVNIVMPR